MSVALINPALLGAVAMASFVAATFFLRFWRQTRDVFFLLFAVAFALDGVTRMVMALRHAADEAVPLYYISRLITFGLIIAAIVYKNRSARRD